MGKILASEAGEFVSPGIFKFVSNEVDLNREKHKEQFQWVPNKKKILDSVDKCK